MPGNPDGPASPGQDFGPAPSIASRNMTRPPGVWQSYQIWFRAPRFDAAGKKTENAKFIRVLFNGLSVQSNIAVDGPTRAAMDIPEAATNPIMLQGDQYVLKDGFTSGYGFDGLVVGLLARGSSIGVVLGALFFGFLRSGGINMEMTARVPSAVVVIIQGLVIIAIAASGYWLSRNEGKR
jgi:hypothetical protein